MQRMQSEKHKLFKLTIIFNTSHSLYTHLVLTDVITNRRKELSMLPHGINVSFRALKFLPN